MSLFDIFAADCAVVLADIGRDIKYRDQVVKAVVSDPAPADMLGIGGFSQGGSSQIFKVLRTTYASEPPKEGELIGFPVVGGVSQVRWVISNPPKSRPDSPWYEIECKRWTS